MECSESAIFVTTVILQYKIASFALEFPFYVPLMTILQLLEALRDCHAFPCILKDFLVFFSLSEVFNLFLVCLL